MKNLKFLILGMYFGVLIVKSEALSWFRIQEMFRLQSFHMFGIFGSAVLVGSLTVFLIKRYQLETLSGQPLAIEKKPLQPTAHVIGGVLFGFGWVLTGLCVAPIFALLGTGYLAAIPILLGALLGVYAYGRFRPILPH
ncbi:MAG: YeeE/YedE family protein [Saprospiraceae bacterium]|nr:YeeE/YedE family protein [Saprospiraceae bacterium]